VRPISNYGRPPRPTLLAAPGLQLSAGHAVGQSTAALPDRRAVGGGGRAAAPGALFPHHTGPHSQGRRRRYRLAPLFAPGRGPRPRPDRDTAERFGDYAALVGERWRRGRQEGHRQRALGRGVVWCGVCGWVWATARPSTWPAKWTTLGHVRHPPGAARRRRARGHGRHRRPTRLPGRQLQQQHVVGQHGPRGTRPETPVSGCPGPTDEQGDGGPAIGGPSDDGPSDGDGGPGDGGRPGTARPGAV